MDHDGSRENAGLFDGFPALPVTGAPWSGFERQVASSFGLNLSSGQVARLRRFVAELEAWSARTNLIAGSSRANIISRHILDSLAPVRLLGDMVRVGDVGSGAGFPGIPIAVARPGPVLLIESRRRRASFLRHVVRSLGLDNVEVVEARAEDLEGPLDVVIGRAVDQETLVAVGARLLPPGGRLVLMEKQGSGERTAPGFIPAGGLAYELPGGLRHRVRVLERCFT